MGDRSNVKFDFGTPEATINLYSHWSGTHLAAEVHRALGSDTARGRWSDPSYLTRIVIHRVLAATADPASGTGYGLSAGVDVDDNEHHILVLHVKEQEVSCNQWRGSYARFCDLDPTLVQAMVD